MPVKESARWIYPSEGPNGVRLSVLDLAFYGEKVKYVTTGEHLWVHSNMAKWLRAGLAKTARIPACRGTHTPMFYVLLSELEL